MNTLSSKPGRPKSANPKDVDLKVRVDSQTNAALLAYCEKTGLTRAEVLRKGLMELLAREK